MKQGYRGKSFTTNVRGTQIYVIVYIDKTCSSKRNGRLENERE